MANCFFRNRTCDGNCVAHLHVDPKCMLPITVQHLNTFLGVGSNLLVSTLGFVSQRTRPGSLLGAAERCRDL